MGMTDEDIDKLSIGEVRAIASRAADALAKFAEARALLGGSPAATVVRVDDFGHPVNRRPPSTKGAELTPDELAQREVLMAARRAPVDPEDFPPEIAKMMRGA